MLRALRRPPSRAPLSPSRASPSSVRQIDHGHHLAAQVDEPGDERRHQKQPRQRPLRNRLLDGADGNAEVLPSDVEAE